MNYIIQGGDPGIPEFRSTIWNVSSAASVTRRQTRETFISFKNSLAMLPYIKDILGEFSVRAA